MADRKVLSIPLNKITIANRERTDLGDLDELAGSIKEKGLIQPITISPDFRLLAGGRRFAAHELLELKTIDCLMRETEDELDEREIELFENLHRKDMNWQEKARSIKRIHELMMEKHGDKWQQRKTAALLGKSQAAVNDYIQLAEALDIIPDLATMPTADAARKRVTRVVTDLKIKKSLQEAKDTGFNVFADNHYIVGNAIEGLSQVTAGIANFAEVDPPYAINLREKRSTRNAGEAVSPSIDTYQEIPEDSYPAFIQKTSAQVYRVLSPNAFCIWWFGPTWHCVVKNILTKTGFHVDDIPGIWNKVNSPVTTAAPNVYLARGYEPFFICRKGNPELRIKARSNVFDFESVPPSQRIHTTERPVQMIQEMIRTFTWPKARIVVPFLGSGNTLWAAYREGLVGWGYDLSEEHRNRFLARMHKEFPDGINTGGDT